MGEVRERVVMRVNFGVAELLVAAVTVILSIGGAWVMVKEQLAQNTQAIDGVVRLTETLNQKTMDHTNEIVLLKERDSQLMKSTESYRDSLVGLRDVLAELNTTLGRMDERMKNVEEGIRDMRE